MTQRKKLLIAIACLSVILCTLVTGTIAWLMDKTDPVTNTFTPSNIKITLEESENLDLKMVPGATITKDPKVIVAADSEDCYVFVKVEENGGNVTVDDNTYTFNSFVSYAMADGWNALENNDGVYYRKVTTSNSDQEFPVLKDDQVTVKSDVTKAMTDALTSDDVYPRLSFTAYAIQSDYLDYPDSATDEQKAAYAWSLVNSSNSSENPNP